jgi:hypothetical protein
MSDDVMDRLKKYAEEQAEKDKKTRSCCRNCAWFSKTAKDSASGRCLRFPPRSLVAPYSETDTAQDLLERTPFVVADWVCGEFLHRLTGDTPYADGVRKLSAMGSRIGQLEDEIDRLKREANS